MPKKRDKDVAFLHYVNLGPWPGYVGATSCEEHFKSEMERLGIEEKFDWLSREGADACTHTFRSKSGSMMNIVTIRPQRKTSPEAYAAMIAHECLHIIQRMREEFNQDKPLGDESEAYLLQYLVQECLQIIKYPQRSKRYVPLGA